MHEGRTLSHRLDQRHGWRIEHVRLGGNQLQGRKLEEGLQSGGTHTNIRLRGIDRGCTKQWPGWAGAKAATAAAHPAASFRGLPAMPGCQQCRATSPPPTHTCSLTVGWKLTFRGTAWDQRARAAEMVSVGSKRSTEKLPTSQALGGPLARTWPCAPAKSTAQQRAPMSAAVACRIFVCWKVGQGQSFCFRGFSNQRRVVQRNKNVNATERSEFWAAFGRPESDVRGRAAARSSGMSRALRRAKCCAAASRAGFRVDSPGACSIVWQSMNPRCVLGAGTASHGPSPDTPKSSGGDSHCASFPFLLAFFGPPFSGSTDFEFHRLSLP